MTFIIGLTFLFGLISLIVPLKFLGLSTRKRGLMLIAISFGLAAVYGIVSGSTNTATSTGTNAPTANTATVTAASSPTVGTSRWRYSEKEDKMRNQITRYASLDSDNQLWFDFPYNGGSTGTLTMRISPNYGKDVILKVDKGQFLCTSEECYVHVKFDNQPIVQYSAGEPSDGTSNVIFIHNYAGFLQKLRSAKKLTIEAEFYQGGSQQLQFSTAGLKW